IESLSASANCTNGSSASRTFSGIASFTFCPKLGLEHLGNRAPILFTRPRVALISSVRAATNASRARSTTKSCRTSRLRCRIGCNDCGSTRPSRANFLASIRSFLRLRRFDPSIRRGLATTTSCPSPAMISCIQGECVPTSITTRADGKAWKNSATSASLVCSCPSLSVSPLQTQNAVVAPLVSQIHSHRQPVQIGTQLGSRTGFSLVRRRRLQLQLSSQFLHQLRQHFLGFSLHWALSFRCPLRSLFLLPGRIAILLQGSISLICCDCTVECVVHWLA